MLLVYVSCFGCYHGWCHYANAIACIPQFLDSLWCNNLGIQAINDHGALGCFVKFFTSKTYLRALEGDTPGSLSSSSDELMQHVASFWKKVFSNMESFIPDCIRNAAHLLESIHHNTDRYIWVRRSMYSMLLFWLVFLVLAMNKFRLNTREKNLLNMVLLPTSFRFH